MSSVRPNPIAMQLKELRLGGMYKAYEEQNLSSSYHDMTFDDRLAFLLQRELTERENKALQSRITKARFRVTGALEDVQPSASRGLDKTLLTQLGQCDWIKDKRNIIITGPSGSGKTFLATALSRKACLLGHAARYFRSTNLLAELESAREEGSFLRTISAIGKPHVLIIDDFCLSALSEAEEKDLFELIEERHGKASTILTSQNPVNLWHGLMPNPAIADAILDRIVHNAIRIELRGESRRKKSADLDSDPSKAS
jgi:DNA replication protein DnaC